jgi:transposase
VDVEIVARVERRRKWTPEEKAALLAEVEAEGGRVALVARRHRISASLLYNWRSAWKAGSCTPAALEFMPLGVFAGAGSERATMLAAPTPEQSQQPQISGGSAGGIEIALPNGARVCVDAFVNEKALSRVLRAMKGTT